MGWLVAIEGIDGSGKATQVAMLADRMRAMFMTVGTASFPCYGETVASEQIAQYLNGKFGSDLDPHLAAMLYALDRYEIRGGLKSMLESYDVVISDRFIESNVAHQAPRLRSDKEVSAFIDWVYDLEHRVFGLPAASTTVLIDMPVEVSTARVAAKSARSYTDKAADMHEADSLYMKRVRDVYRRQAVDNEWVVVCALDADKRPKSVEEINDEILRAVLRQMGQLWRLDPQWEFDRVAVAQAIHKSWSQNTWESSSKGDREDSLKSADLAIEEVIRQLSKKGSSDVSGESVSGFDQSEVRQSDHDGGVDILSVHSLGVHDAQVIRAECSQQSCNPGEEDDQGCSGQPVHPDALGKEPERHAGPGTVEPVSGCSMPVPVDEAPVCGSCGRVADGEGGAAQADCESPPGTMDVDHSDCNRECKSV
jgi:dTMP kinase